MTKNNLPKQYNKRSNKNKKFIQFFLYNINIEFSKIQNSE